VSDGKGPANSRGLYEQLITEALEADLQSLGEGLTTTRSDLRRAEAGDRLALHLARLVENAVGGLDEKKRVKRGISLTRNLIATLARELGNAALLAESPVLEESVLRAILARNPDGSVQEIAEPLIPLLDTTLLTNAPGEPRVGHQLETEIDSAHQIDLVMAFVRRSGIRPFMPAFRRHCEADRPLRLLTTTYTNSTEQHALEELAALGAEVRVSYDTTGTRLHAKAWHFHRAGGMSTAYIGSSNLTHQAQRTGLEWNVRVSGARNRSVVDKMAAVVGRIDAGCGLGVSSANPHAHAPRNPFPSRLRPKVASDHTDAASQEPATHRQVGEAVQGGARTMSDETLQWGWKRIAVTESQLADPEPEAAPDPTRPRSTFIASGALFEGTLRLTGDFQIDSDFRGELRTDGKVVIGPDGSVEGDIHANEVEILGAVVGDVSARRELVLRAGARLHGKVTTACLEIERHAFFTGETMMTEPQRHSRTESRDVAPVDAPASHPGAAYST